MSIAVRNFYIPFFLRSICIEEDHIADHVVTYKNMTLLHSCLNVHTQWDFFSSFGWVSSHFEEFTTCILPHRMPGSPGNLARIPHCGGLPGTLARIPHCVGLSGDPGEDISLCRTPRNHGQDTSLCRTPREPWSGYLTV